MSTGRNLHITIAFLIFVLGLLLVAGNALGSTAESGPAVAAANPPKSEIKTMLYNAAVARGIPPEILYGIAYQESGWQQFRSDGTPLDSYDGYGSGIMQVSYGSCVNYPAHKCYEDTNSIRYDINYNINAGADILIDKWNSTPSIGDDNTNCYENWFYAVWAYNGWTVNNEYPYTVFSHIATGPYDWWTGVPVTPVPREWRVDGKGVQVATPQPSHFWYVPESPDTKPYRSYFSWYDNVGGKNWVLMSNPGTDSSRFALSVGGQAQSLTSLTGVPGEVPVGGVLYARYANLMGGPVVVGSTLQPLVSQRILWGGNSLEEVLGIDEASLSAHYYWPWYDMATPGYKDWVLVGNPGASAVSFQIRIAGRQVAAGTVNPGQQATYTFPGVMAGPVEITASDRIIASQRVLSNYDQAFNEVPGIPAEELSDHFIWTWYDNASAGATDWILIANPGTRVASYEISIAGNRVATGTVAPGQKVTPTFPGSIGGPVEVKASDLVIASQRVVWGPSFEEVPGYRYSQLRSHYSWTWYDNQSVGSSNWVLVANPGTAAVTYEIKIAGNRVSSGSLAPGQKATPTFPGTMAGPVEVTASGPIMASQRVLWNGFFNEVLGKG
ncbi:MAG: transglycosylase SLT domain-containing protein [Thermoleophilia bacterium]